MYIYLLGAIRQAMKRIGFDVWHWCNGVTWTNFILYLTWCLPSLSMFTLIYSCQSTHPNALPAALRFILLQSNYTAGWNVFGWCAGKLYILLFITFCNNNNNRPVVCLLRVNEQSCKKMHIIVVGTVAYEQLYVCNYNKFLANSQSKHNSLYFVIVIIMV